MRKESILLIVATLLIFSNIGTVSATIQVENLKQLTDDPAIDFAPSWSPDGNDILVQKRVNNRPEFTVKVDVNNSSETILTDWGCARWDWSNFYSPDGTKIVYGSDIDNCNGWLAVYVMNSDGSSNIGITGRGYYRNYNIYPIWYPTKNKIIYGKAWDCCNRYTWNLISADPDGSNKTTLVSGIYSQSYFAMSPDESKIVYSATTSTSGNPYRYGKWMLHIKDLNTGITTNLDSEVYSDHFFPRQSQSWQSQIFSPDGSKVVYESNENGNWDIFSINTDGTGKIQLTTNPSNDRNAYFSPDGNKIVFVSNSAGNNDIWVMDADGNNKVQLTTDTSNEVHPSWSPDGSKIAFESNRLGNYDLWVMELSENEPPVGNAGGPYSINEGSIIEFDGSASYDPDVGDSIVSYEWDLDGDGIYYASGVTVSNTWTDDYSGTLTLKVTDSFGATDTALTTVTVNNVAPTVYIGEDQDVTAGDAVNFSGIITDPGADTHTITWDFGDGNTATGLTATNTYTNAGTYIVTLTVTDDDGGVGTDTVKVTVDPIPAYVNCDPQTLNIMSKGKWITCYLELSGIADVKNIDGSTVELSHGGASVGVENNPKYGFVTDEGSYIMDKDGNGILERMVKFERDAVESLFRGPVDPATLVISGKISQNGMGIDFEGIDYTRVIKESINNGKKK